MPRIVRLDQLRSDARLFADQRVGTAAETAVFINTTELTRLCNLKLSELYDKLVAARGNEYFGAVSALSIVSGTSEYPLPQDFYQLSSLTLEWAPDDHEELTPLSGQNGRARYVNQQTWGNKTPKTFRVRGLYLEFIPTPTTSVTARLRYVQMFRDLSNDTDTFDGINGWEKLVALGVAIEMRTIRKDPVDDLESLYQEQLARIDALATDRLVEHAKEVRNVETFDGFPGGRRRYWYPRGGSLT